MFYLQRWLITAIVGPEVEKEWQFHLAQKIQKSFYPQNSLSYFGNYRVILPFPFYSFKREVCQSVEFNNLHKSSDHSRERHYAEEKRDNKKQTNK